ncbi:MAG: hypothetical protein AB1428_06855 [Bacteroidota bacterium]
MKRSLGMIVLAGFLSCTLLQAQEKSTLSTYRVFPKPGKDSALRKAIADHVARFHTGSWKWRAFRVLSGADEGSYQLNEGLNSWTELEGRKDISDEHTRDYETNVLPLTEKATPNAYFLFRREFSSDSVGNTFKKALLRHFYPRPGRGVRLMETLGTWKKVWEKLGMKVTVWSSFFSGEPQWVVAARLPKGFVDLEQPMGKAMADTYEAVAGPGAYGRFLDDLNMNVARIDEEIIEWVPELSSK